MWRQGCLLLTIGVALTATACAGAESAEVNLDYVAQRALERAQKPFHSPRARTVADCIVSGRDAGDWHQALPADAGLSMHPLVGRIWQKPSCSADANYSL